LYLAEAKAIPAEFDVMAAAAQAGLDPEWTELAAPLPNYYNLEEALLRLAARGAHLVEAVPATYHEDHGLRLSRNRFRLLG
jgi:hypothetical protein